MEFLEGLSFSEDDALEEGVRLLVQPLKNPFDFFSFLSRVEFLLGGDGEVFSSCVTIFSTIVLTSSGCLRGVMVEGFGVVE